MDLKTFIHELPKVELHVHLEGCLTPSLARKLAQRNNIPLPESIARLSHKEDGKGEGDKGKGGDGDGYAFHDLASFLEVYYPALDVLRTERDFFDLAWDYLSRAKEQNIRHVELFFDPQAHTSRGIPLATVVNGYTSALVQSQRTHKISSNLILCILRDHAPASGLDTLKSFLSLPPPSTSISHNDDNISIITDTRTPLPNLVIGLGLDSNEHNNPPIKFQQIYDLARSSSLNLTAHCDIDQKDTLLHIEQVLFSLKCTRIDHGTNVIASPSLTSHIITNKIGLTTCPISNSICTEGGKFKDILTLLRMGVKVTINSDDPAYFRGYVEENFGVFAQEMDVTRDELVLFVRNAVEICWVGEDRRRELMGEVEEFERRALGAGN